MAKQQQKQPAPAAPPKPLEQEPEAAASDLADCTQLYAKGQPGEGGKNSDSSNSSPPPPKPPIVVDPWWEVQAGDLPRMDVQAPNEEAAIMLYKMRLRVTGPQPTAKRVT